MEIEKKVKYIFKEADELISISHDRIRYHILLLFFFRIIYMILEHNQ